MAQSQQPLTGGVPDAPAAHHLGDLARSDRRWNVYLELRPQGRSVGGRLHFVEADARRTSAWIFLEDTEQEILSRFNEFSPVELWRLAESLDG